MKYQALFFMKSNEKLFKTVVCCSRDWRLRGEIWFIYLCTLVFYFTVFNDKWSEGKHLHVFLPIFFFFFFFTKEKQFL